MLDGIMSLAGVPDKLQQFISIVMEAADKYQDAEKAAALEAVDVTGREKAGEIVGDAAIVERLAREMTRCAYAVKPDGAPACAPNKTSAPRRHPIRTTRKSLRSRFSCTEETSGFVCAIYSFSSALL